MAQSGDGVLRNGVIEHAGANTPGWISNLGIKLNAGVFSIVDAQGATLSKENPGFITVPSVTAGQLVTLKVTTGGTFNDDSHASSSLTNMGFGITETVNWANAMSFFIYVLNKGDNDIAGNDGDSVFFISRAPNVTKSHSDADDIGDLAAVAVNDLQQSFLVMSTITKANYVDLPCQVCGAFDMTWSTATDDWTVSALSNTAGDGMGLSQVDNKCGNIRTMPLNQNGAATGTFLLNNGGTAPVFTTNGYTYQLFRNGTIHVNINLDGDGGTDGSGAVNTLVALPASGTFTVSTCPGSAVTFSGGSGKNVIVTFGSAPASFSLTETSGNSVENADFTNGARTIRTSFIYNAFSAFP